MKHPDIPTPLWIGAADNEMMRRVQKWLADGRTLAWLPIFNRENFPAVPPEILYFAELSPERHVWFVDEADDFLEIPDGITGWLLPEGDKDTDVVVGLWEDKLYFLSATDKRTGDPQTLQSGRNWEVADEPAETSA